MIDMNYFISTPRKCFKVVRSEFVRLIKNNIYPHIGFGRLRSDSYLGSHCIIRISSSSLIDKSHVL